MTLDELPYTVIGVLQPRPNAGGLASDIDSVLAGFVRGQLTVCAILGTFYALALMLAGLQFGLVIGLGMAAILLMHRFFTRATPGPAARPA